MDVKFVVLALLFLTSCSSLPKGNNLPSPMTPLKEEAFYNGICYSFKTTQYTFFSKARLVSITEDGVTISLKSDPEPVIVKQECILERTGFNPVLTGEEPKISFVCAMDDVGDIVFRGDEFFVLKFYGENLISLYDQESKRELIVWKNKCSVVEPLEE